ncbi:MAG: hypothetical protein JSV60_05345, partial [Desulfobacterales bacterium]
EPAISKNLIVIPSNGIMSSSIAFFPALPPTSCSYKLQPVHLYHIIIAMQLGELPILVAQNAYGDSEKVRRKIQ